MIAPRQCAVAMVMALAGAAFAQNTGEPDIPALIEQLGDEGTRKAATRRLVSLGEPAAMALLGVVSREGQENGTEALLVLARMRDHAGSIVPVLVKLRHLPGKVWPAFIRAVADLGPYTRMERVQLLSPFGENLQRAAAGSGPELAAEIYNETIRMSGRITVTSIRSHSEIGELVSSLETGASDSRVLAAELLGYRGPSAASALPALRDALLMSHPDAPRATQPRRGRGARLVPGNYPVRRVPMNREIHRAAARAMEEIAPGHADVALAMAHRLTHDPDAEERMDAAMALGRLGEGAAEARVQLLDALHDPDLRVVREVITALGILGHTGREGIPGLEKLASHEDPQIAERAKAALRLIRRGGPRGYVVDPPVVPWNYEGPATPVEKARAMKARADIAALKSTVDMYLLRSRSRDLPTWELLIQPDDRGNAWLEGYKDPPKDPWGNEYELRPGERGRRDYEVRSRGPDGMPNTDDDISSKSIKDR